MGALSLPLRQILENDQEAALYPADRLRDAETALMGFCAAFHGKQDCVWVADAGLAATAIDIDQAKLDEMKALYPDDWTFVCADVFEFAAARRAAGDRYDLVNLDPPSNLFQPVADQADLWCALARNAVLLATGPKTTVEAPPGWEQTGHLHRSNFLGGVYWTILEPERAAITGGPLRATRATGEPDERSLRPETIDA